MVCLVLGVTKSSAPSDVDLAGLRTDQLELAGTMTEGLELAGTVTTELDGEVDWVNATEGMVETEFEIGLSLSGGTFSFCMAFFLSLDLFTLSLFCLRIFSS